MTHSGPRIDLDQVHRNQWSQRGANPLGGYIPVRRAHILSSADAGKKTIGLCLSGGGHRASIFGLGALLYLVDADRHRDIKAISSVSGGSLTSGFFAAQSNPIHLMDREEFDDCAASWARQIAGSPAWWSKAFTIHVLMFVVWAFLVCTIWGWFPWLAPLTHFLPPWWTIQIGYVGAVFIWARIVGCRPGGTLWGWWGTWLYLGIFLPAVFLLILVWWSPLSRWWCMLIATFAAGVIGLRTYVADLAFRVTVCRSKQLGKIQPTPLHVFCATEMQEGRHVFFARDFIYSRAAGLGEPAGLALSATIQASANFPIAFPYRLFLLRNEYKFRLPSRIPSPKQLVLSDGGVQDNTGITWFSEASERNALLRQTFRLLIKPEIESSHPSLWLPEADRERVLKQLEEMEDLPDLWVVVNSSFPKEWSAIAWWQSIPVIGEIAALLSVPGVIYECRGREQSRQLHRSFFNRAVSGAVVSIEQYPQYFYRIFLDPPETKLLSVSEQLGELGISDLSRPLLERYTQRARAVDNRQKLGPDYEKTYKTEADQDAARLQELADRLQQLQALKSPATGSLDEAARLLDYEIFECEDEMSSIEQHQVDMSHRKDRAILDWEPFVREAMETKLSSETPTSLRPLGISATSALLRHGYLNCMNICHLLHDGFPRFDEPPSLDEMKKLALGLRRGRYPSSYATD
jgi:predicted acylesterase/phospholipase RssA